MSGLRLPSRGSMITSAEADEREERWRKHEEAELAKRAAKEREYAAECVGGFRALDEFKAENFIPSAVTAAAFEAAKGFDTSVDGLYLHGSTGSGKSHLATVAARKTFNLPNWRGQIITTTPMEISRRLRACDGGAAEEEAIQDIINCKTLVIEDIGVAKDTEFLISTMYEIINGRYQRYAGGLIVTSNLSLSELARKLNDDRVSSRISQMCKIFNFAGERDHRPPQRKA